MRKMLCRDLGGECDEELHAESWKKMVIAMTKHVREKHPETAKQMKKMHKEDPEKWGKEMLPKWEATPEEE